MSIYLYLITIVIMGILMQIYFKQRDYFNNRTKAIIVKSGCTLIPVLLCLYASIQIDANPAKWFLFAGLFFCMLGDAFIELQIEAGIIAFFLAHICFITYFLNLAPLNSGSFLIFLVLYAGVLCGFWKYVATFGSRLAAFLAYPAILVLMFSIAALLPFAFNSAGAVCLAVGAGLFVTSDLILASNTVGTSTQIKSRLVMYLYYPAVYLLAVSAFYM